MTSPENIIEVSFNDGPLQSIGRIPQVRLERFFPDQASFNNRIAEIADKATEFQRAYAGTVAQLGAHQLAKFLDQAEVISTLIFSTGQFLDLVGAKHLDASDQISNAKLRLQDASKPFYSAVEEFNRLDPEVLHAFSLHPALDGHKAFLEREARTRKYEPARHGVTYEEIAEIGKKEIADARAYADLKRKIDERILLNPQEHVEIRQRENSAHADEFAVFLSNSHRTLADIQKRVGMDKPYGMMCLSREITAGDLDTLTDTVRDARQIRHDFWRWRAAQQGTETIGYHAPKLGDMDRTIYPWNVGKELVTSAYHRFSPELGKIVNAFYDDWRIDAAPVPNRAAINCAFAGSSYSEPVIFFSYYGRRSDIVKKAHELAHGVHGTLAAKHQRHANSTPNLLVSETVAAFGEGLLHDEKLRRAKTDEEKAALKAEELEKRLNTIFYFAAVNDFEIAVHELALKGKANGEAIGTVWRDTHLAYAGNAVHIAQKERHDWIDCDTIFKSSFYMASYSFAGLMADHLRRDHAKRGEAFVHDFMELLRAGSSKPTLELLKPFGIEKLDKPFWQNCMALLKADVDQFIADNPAPPPPSGAANPRAVVARKEL